MSSQIQKIPFYGEISEKGALQRKETTERYIITITAERGGKKRVATADFRVIGTGDSAFSEVLGEVLSERIYAESEDTELLSVLGELCAAGDFRRHLRYKFPITRPFPKTTKIR